MRAGRGGTPAHNGRRRAVLVLARMVVVVITLASTWPLLS